MSLPVAKEQHVKQPVDIAVSCGRAFQSPETGFFHYSYQSSDQVPHQAVPFVENILFVLALLRLRTKEAVLEASGLLERLLAYQEVGEGEAKGNFPLYLHDFPACRDRYLPFQLLLPFFRILEGYGPVLGNGLKHKLNRAIQLLLPCCWRIQETEKTPYIFSMKLACASIRFARHYGESLGVEKGEKLLRELKERGITLSWFTPDQLGDLLLSLQLLGEEETLLHTWKPLWEHAVSCWYQPLLCYVGPAFHVRQVKEEQQATVYDLFMGHVAGAYSHRVFEIHPYQLQAALIYPSKLVLPEKALPYSFEGVFEEKKWKVYQGVSFAYSWIEQESALRDYQKPVMHPFYFVWGSPMRMHSLSLQGDQFSKLKVSDLDTARLELQVEMPYVSNHQDDEKELSLAFYVDRTDQLKKLVAGKPATIFEWGETVELIDQALALKLKFSSGGEGGTMIGSIHPGNRPAQIALKGAGRFEAYDQMVSMRTVSQKAPIGMTVLLEVL
jgi:hypothetical protein